MEKFENNQHFRNNFFGNHIGSAAILQTLGVKYALQWTLHHSSGPYIITT
jgi:hypothetical protein